MSNYEVKYDIQVTTGNSVGTLQAFEQAVAPLKRTAETLDTLARVVKRFSTAAGNIKPLKIQVTVDTSAEKQIDRLLQKIRTLRREAGGALNISGVVGGGSSNRGSNSRSGGSTYVSTGGRGSARSSRGYVGSYSRNARATAQSAFRRGGNMSGIGYKVLGPTPIDVNGVAAIDFLKGMGIAYGIAGAGQMVSTIVKSATEYNNLMQSTRNILQTHDKKGNFNNRFVNMEKIIRDVGVQTKFTAPEVADAAKFLAMAGLDVEGINQSIRPIADIALVGDTDLGKTADVVTNIMTAYRRSPSEMRRTADVMTMTFTKSNTTLTEMAEAYKYSAALLSAGGVSFEEASGALGVLGDAGIKGSQAGTTMRTIMANLVNPTKKQLTHWEELGIERFDENGNLRSLRNIFKDLYDADLKVQDFYKLFHKTAAQGAVSLANSVEKWNEIVVDNFLSDGLSKQLAEKKKETIQGLWAQLTSAFTEDGMQAFEGVQEVIKDSIRSVIAWLKKPETVDLFHSAAKGLIEFTSVMANSLKQIYSIFSNPLVAFLTKLYIKFQLLIWPILAIVRAVKSLLLLGKGLMSLRFGFGTLMTTLGVNPALIASSAVATRGVAGAGGVTATAAGASMLINGWYPYRRRGFKNNLERLTSTGKLNSVSTFLSGGMLPLTRGNALRAGIIAAEGMPKSMNLAERRALWRDEQNKLMQKNYGIDTSKWKEGHFKQWYRAKNGGAVNGILVDRNEDLGIIRENYHLAKLDENFTRRANRRAAIMKEAHRWQRQRAFAGGLGALAGLGTGAMIASAGDWSSSSIAWGGLSTALGIASMGGPVGWVGGAVVAVGSLLASLAAASIETSRAQAAMDSYIQSIQTHNGIWVGEGASIAQRQLAITKSENADLNTLMQTRIKLMREILEMSSAPVDSTATTLSKTVVDEAIQRFDKIYNWYDKTKAGQTAIEWSNKYKSESGVGQIFRDSLTGDLYVYGLDGKNHKLNDPNNTFSDWSNENTTAMAYAIALEFASRGEESKAIADRFVGLKTKALWSHKSLEEIKDIAQEYEAQYGAKALFGYTDQNGEYIPGRLDNTTLPENWNYGYDTFKEWDGKQWSNTYPYLAYLYSQYNDKFGLNAPYIKAAETYFAKRDSGNYDEYDIFAFIAEFDEKIGGYLQDYSEKYVEQWFAHIGYSPSERKFIHQNGQQGDENAQLFLGFVDMMNRLIPTFTPEEQAKMAEFVQRMYGLANIALVQTGQTPIYPGAGAASNPAFAGYKVGDTVNIEGKTWMRGADGKWWNGLTAGKTYTDQQVSALTQAQAVNQENAANDAGGNNTPPPKHTVNTGNNTGSNTGYKNNYSGTAAAPKQIIINIDSLMNVEAIDLTKSDNKFAVENVKEQLSQALIEVVHDFSISSGNMV